MLAIAIEKGECDEEDPLTMDQCTDHPGNEVDGGCTCDRMGICKCALATLLSMLVATFFVLVPYMVVRSIENSDVFDVGTWVWLVVGIDLGLMALCTSVIGAWLMIWKMASVWTVWYLKRST